MSLIWKLFSLFIHNYVNSYKTNTEEILQTEILIKTIFNGINYSWFKHIKHRMNYVIVLFFRFVRKLIK